MNSLSQREAEIVKALVIEGRMAREVAEEADLDISHIYRIRRKAIAKLRKWLKADEATSAM
ncbi:MAG: sigma factor-like helix-turn-helix DNA-binding protein [Synergistaceae bacterium]